MKRIIRILFKLVNGGGALGAVILVFVWGSICINVAMRYLFGRPQAWAIELSEYAILYITFLGGAYVLREEGHVKVDWVVGRLRPRSAALLEIANSVAGALLCLIITWYGVATTWSHYTRNIYRVTTLETPTFLILAVIPIGSFLLSVQFFRRAYEKMKIVRSSSENNRD